MSDETRLSGFKTIQNPLTIIALFAALAEISGTVVLLNLGEQPEIQKIFVWFVMVFPTLLILCFFYTLNSNASVLFGPNDFDNDQGFLQAQAIQLWLSRQKNISPIKVSVDKESIGKVLKDKGEKEAQPTLQIPQLDGSLVEQGVNLFINELVEELKEELQNEVIRKIDFNLQDLSYLLIEVELLANGQQQATRYPFILHLSPSPNRKLLMKIIGKGIANQNPKIIAQQLGKHIQGLIPS